MGNAPKFYKAPRYVLRKRNILAFLKGHPEINTFLDVGCGAGELACTLAQNGLKGTAIDFSSDAIKHAEQIRKQRGLSATDVKFIVGGLEKVGNKKFDLVICSEVLEHVEDDRAMLRNLLKHSERMLISVPAKQKLFDSSDEAVGHFRRYEKSQLQQMIEEEGLRIVNFVNYGYPFTNLVRLVRKAAFRRKLRKTSHTTMEDKSKESGINPIKLPDFLHKIDSEKALAPLYHFSRLFNRTNLGEGYLLLCEKSE